MRFMNSLSNHTCFFVGWFNVTRVRGNVRQIWEELSVINNSQFIYFLNICSFFLSTHCCCFQRTLHCGAVRAAAYHLRARQSAAGGRWGCRASGARGHTSGAAWSPLCIGAGKSIMHYKLAHTLSQKIHTVHIILEKALLRPHTTTKKVYLRCTYLRIYIAVCHSGRRRQRHSSGGPYSRRWRARANGWCSCAACCSPCRPSAGVIRMRCLSMTLCV